MIIATEVGHLAALQAEAQGHYGAARRIEERVIELRTSRLGETYSGTLVAKENLAGVLLAQGDHAGARVLYERVLETRAREFGGEDTGTLISTGNLAGALQDAGDYAGARRLQERVLEGMTRLLERSTRIR
jgi:hypothetical protein